jgi:hypothetical protein
MGGDRFVAWGVRCLCLLGLIAFLSVRFMGCMTTRATHVPSLDQWVAEDEELESTAAGY